MSNHYEAWVSRRRPAVSDARVAESNRYFAKLLKKAAE